MTGPVVDARHFTQAATRLSKTQQVVAAQNIVNSQGIKVLEKGASISEELYERLMQHRLATPLEETVTATNAVSASSLRQQVEDLGRDVPFFGRLLGNEAEARMMLGAIGGIPLPDAVAFQLTVARDVRPEVYSHLVRTTLVCTWLANVPGVSRYELGMAASAGLLHDIGMLHVDPQLTQPYQILSAQQRTQLYSHPLVSAALLERHHQYPAEVVRAIGEHQEYMDGSGYPRALAGRHISPLGRIVALSQVAAAMFAPGRDAPEMRISVLLRMTTNLYDNKLAARLLTQLQPRLENAGAGRARMQDPVKPMLEVDGLLGTLPTVLQEASVQGHTRNEELQHVVVHAERIRKGLARVGAAPEQLASLRGEELDEGFLDEMSLLATEAVWQLRTLARHVGRRVRAPVAAQGAARGALHDWLKSVDDLVESAGSA